MLAHKPKTLSPANIYIYISTIRSLSEQKVHTFSVYTTIGLFLYIDFSNILVSLKNLKNWEKLFQALSHKKTKIYYSQALIS